MASDNDDPPPAPVACSACRGTGRVISNLGDKRNEVVCPWCEGGGMRVVDHDAQAALRGDGSDEPPDQVA